MWTEKNSLIKESKELNMEPQKVKMSDRNLSSPGHLVLILKKKKKRTVVSLGRAREDVLPTPPTNRGW